MSNLEQRENRRKSIVANMVNEPEQPATSGRGRPRENREKKKSVTLSLLPSLHEDIQKIAYVQRRSVSNIVEEQLRRYREEHNDALSEYEKIKK